MKSRTLVFHAWSASKSGPNGKTKSCEEALCLKCEDLRHCASNVKILVQVFIFRQKLVKTISAGHLNSAIRK